MTSTDTPVDHSRVVQKDRVVIRFAGDSGDGMQLTGDRFTSETAAFGNDLSTLPNFPAEIRAPAGTLPGVSSFQLHFANYDILTPGDRPDVLVAMNPAALKANIADVPRGAVIIANTDEFTKRNLTKVGYAANPLEDGSLDQYAVYPVAMATLTRGALEDTGLSKKDAERAKNMFALGLLSWMYHRPHESTERFLREKFARRPEIAEANILAFKAGHAYGETTEAFAVTYEVAPAHLAAGTYRQITGNTALAYGIVAAGQVSGLPVFLGSYPITPASDILHELSKHKAFNVTTFQAEDEIAGIGAALGAAFGGALGVTTTSGPGVSLKSRDDLARGGAGAAAAGGRRAARRPVHRAAHQDRAGRSPAVHVRPQRRGPAADHRAALARRLLRGGAGGGPHRGHLPHPRAAALGRLAGQRVRAVAGARRGRPAEVRPGVRHRCRTRPTARSSGRTCATPTRWPARGPCPAPRAGAPHRRPGEGRRARRHLLRARQPRPHDPAARGEDRRHPGARRRGRRPHGGRHGCSSSAGAPRTARSGRARGGCGRWGTRSPPPTCGTSTRCREPRRSVGALRERAHPRDEPRAAVPAPPRPLPRGREELHEGLRSAV